MATRDGVILGFTVLVPESDHLLLDVIAVDPRRRANLGWYPRRGYRETHRAEEHGFRRVFFSKTLHPDEPAPPLDRLPP